MSLIFYTSWVVVLDFKNIIGLISEFKIIYIHKIPPYRQEYLFVNVVIIVAL